MPRGYLTEKYVQKVAVDSLTAYYCNKFATTFVKGYTEKRVRPSVKLKNGRADGLIVTYTSDGTFYVASIEAKSSKTRRNIRKSHNEEKWLNHAILMAGILSIVALILGISANNGWIICLAPIVIFVVAVLTFLTLTASHPFYQHVAVINQVKRYPAHEQWIALSTDVYNTLSQEERSNQGYDLAREGIGLMLVSAGNRTRILIYPKMSSVPKNQISFLDCYLDAKSIRKELEIKIAIGRDNLLGHENNLIT